MTLCECGCGGEAKEGKRFILGHNRKGKTKENDESVRRAAEKMSGRTKENDEAVRRMAETKRGRTGELASGWKGGISFEPYCEKFDEDLKERVREFFGRCCYVCGISESKLNQKLDVNYVNYQKMACCEEEIKPLFVPLCRSCHSKTQRDRKEWEEFFTISLNYLTGGKCFYTKKEIGRKNE